MAQFKSRAFVLSTAPYRESSALLEVLCEQEGRITLVARGRRAPAGKRRDTSVLDAFEMVEVTYGLKPGSTIGNANTIDTIRVYPEIRGQLVAYAVASYWFEIIRALCQARVPSRELFGLTEQLLAGLDQGSRSPTAAVLRCFVVLLQVEGIGLEQWKQCGTCGGRGLIAHFDLLSRRPVCGRCAQPGGRYFPLPDGMLGRLSSAFESVERGERVELPAGDLRAFFALFNELLLLELEKPVRSFDFLYAILCKPQR